MYNTVVFDGDLDLLICEDGELGEFIEIHDRDIPAYTGDYTVTPTFADQSLETQGLYMLDDVTVEAIEVSRTTNPSGGTTVYIGGIN